MKVLVLGATGGPGRLIVGDALTKGHSVVALVRSKARALGSPPQRAGRRRDNPKGREPVRRKNETVFGDGIKSLHDFNLETFGTEVLLTLASVTTG